MPTDRLTPEQEQEIRARLAAATPGPWVWCANLRSRRAYLATQRWGRHFVMQFARWGFQDAQPVFRVAYTNGDDATAPLPRNEEGRPGSAMMRPLSELGLAEDHNGEVRLDHPDAALIANAPADLAALLAEVEALREDAARLDWLEARSYTVYRSRDPEHGKLVDHATVVNEDGPGSRRGHVAPTLRGAIDTARAWEDRR